MLLLKKYNAKTLDIQNHILSKINSLMIAILLTSNFITQIFASLEVINENLLPIIFIVSLLGSYFTAIILGYKFNTLSKQSIIFLYFIFIVFIVTFLIQGTNSYVSQYFIEFIAFGVIIFMLTVLPFSSTTIIIFTMHIGNLILINPFGFADFISLDALYDRVEMGASYSMLPSVVATIIYFFFIRKNYRSKISIISYFSNGYMLYLLITEGTRGAVLATFILLLFVLYIKITYKSNMKYKYFISSGILILTLISLVIIVFNLKAILSWINKTLQGIGFESATIIKTLSMIEGEGWIGILNSRNLLYEDAFQLFVESPLWGHGIGSYANIYNGIYPHNLFLQLLVEGGILFVIPFTIILIFCFWLLIKPWSHNSSEIKLLILMLFIISVPRLMFSSYLWHNQAFWLLIFVYLTKCKTIAKFKVKFKTGN